MSITYPPELLPSPDEGQGADVWVHCTCGCAWDPTMLASCPVCDPKEITDSKDAISRCEFCGNQYGDDRCGCDAAKDAEITKLTSQLETLRGAMKADDERLRAAGLRSDCYAGCDTPEAMVDKIELLKSQFEEARADDYIDKLNVLCEDFGCEGGSDRLAWLHDELSKISRLQSRIEELERALKPFAEYATCKCDCCNYDEDVIAGPVTNDLNFPRVITMGDLRQARSALEASNKGGK